jgi:hypothetical protein
VLASNPIGSSQSHCCDVGSSLGHCLGINQASFKSPLNDEQKTHDNQITRVGHLLLIILHTE